MITMHYDSYDDDEVLNDIDDDYDDINDVDLLYGDDDACGSTSWS